MGFGLVSSAYVQTQIIHSITEDFKLKTQQEFTIEKVSLRWNGKLQFSDFYIEDHHGDTLLYIKEFKTSILDFNKLNESNFNFDDVEASQVYFNLKKYSNEETHSLKILMNKLKKDSTTKKKFLVGSNSIRVVKGDFLYHDLNKEPARMTRINDLTLFGTNLTYEGNHLDLKLKNLMGVLISPEELPISLTGDLHYEPGFLKIDSLEMESRSNRFKGKVALKGVNKTLRNFFPSGSIELEVNDGALFLGDFLKDTPYFMNRPAFDISFSLNGPMNALEFSDIDISNSEFLFNGALGVEHFFDEKPLSFLADIEEVELFASFIAENIPSLKNKQKEYLKSLEKFQFSGTVSSSNNHLDLDLRSSNRWGYFSVFGAVGNGFFETQKEDRGLDLSINLKNISLDEFTNQNQGLRLFSELKLNGTVPISDPMDLKWKAINTHLSSTKILLDDINFEGRFKDNQLRNTLSIESKPIKLKSDILFDFTDELPKYTLVANIKAMDLNSLGLQVDSSKKIFSGVTISNFKGFNWDDLVGELKISSASITNASQTVFLNPISIKKKLSGMETELVISNSDCISGSAKGVFKMSELQKLFQNALHQVYPFLPQKTTSEGQYLSFKLKIYEKLLDALYPSMSISENIFLKGRLASDFMRSEVTLDAPILRWNDLELQNIHFQLDTKNPLYNSFVSVGDFKHKYYTGKEFNMISTQLKDTLYFRSEFLGEKNIETPFDVNFYHTREKNGVSHIGFKKSILPMGSDTWTINPTDTSNQKITYSPTNKTVKITELNAVSGRQSIFLSGSHKNADEFKFDIKVRDVLLAHILPENPVFQLEGEATVSGSIERSDSNNKMNLVGEVKDMIINQQDLGDFKISSNGDTKTNIYYADLNLVNKNQNSLSVVGIWDGLENPKLNYDLTLNSLDLSFLSPLGKEAINQFNGVVKGFVNIVGPLDDLKHNGSLTLNQGGFRVPYLNVGYTVEQTEVQLYDQVFAFKNAQMKDIDQSTTAVLDGTFSHTNFKDWNTNLRIGSNRMLLLNTVQNPESLFFGQGYLEGEVRLEGPTKDMKISVEGKTDTDTSIKIPWAEDYGLSDTSFISFIDKNSQNQFTASNPITQIDEIRGLELNFELDVTNEAEIEIVIDQETGSYLSGKGAGNLFMEINTNGKFNMWGDFITYEGIYNFKNLGVIDKKFNVKPGGTIVWEGNPLEAQMDLEAVYDVPGGANPALLLDNPNFNKKIPTEVLIRLQGNLLKPDDPIFEIDFPNTSGTVASEINYRLSDPQRSQLQAISLLSQGIFINEVSVSMQGITNNLYQKASDVFSDLIGEENDKLKVGIDYLQGDKSALLDIATEDRLGFTLSTKISDRILLNGKIGVPVGGVEQTLIVGNVQIDFVLNEEGSLRAKIFNKENEFRYIGDELGYTQGVGLSYNVDFDTFKELINKISTNNSALKEDETSATEQNQNKEVVQFINKNP